MGLSHGAYQALSLAVQGKFPDKRTKKGRVIKDWIEGINQTYPDELLNEALKRDKQRVVFPAVVFLVMHPGYVNGEGGCKLAEDYKHYQGVYYRYMRILGKSLDGKSEGSHDLYERMRERLLECDE